MRNTYTAALDLLQGPGAQEGLTIHSPRVNAGLFQVPWELTEAALKRALDGTPHTWTVWTLP